MSNHCSGLLSPFHFDKCPCCRASPGIPCSSLIKCFLIRSQGFGWGLEEMGIPCFLVVFLLVCQEKRQGEEEEDHGSDVRFCDLECSS